VKVGPKPEVAPLYLRKVQALEGLDDRYFGIDLASGALGVPMQAVPCQVFQWKSSQYLMFLR
jgi:hypothetical protein